MGLIGTSCPPTGRSTPCSKGSAQGKANGDMRIKPFLALLSIFLLAGPVLAGCGGAKKDGRETPSGFPVPRYLSLKFGEVNARAGPSEDSPLRFVYRAKGLPLQVVAETTEWRRVCDPEGNLVWVHKRGVDGVRTVMRTAADPLPLLAEPKAGARTVAYLTPRAIAAYAGEKDGWVHISADGASGWAPVGAVWGVAPAQQCK
jgi:SH3-like domain-containing protein